MYGNNTLRCKKDCIDDLINDLDSFALLSLDLFLDFDDDEELVVDVDVSTAPFRSKGLVQPHNAPTSIIDNISSDNQLLLTLVLLLFVMVTNVLSSFSLSLSAALLLIRVLTNTTGQKSLGYLLLK